MPHQDEVHFEGSRLHFPDHFGWKISYKGNKYIRLDNGFVITVYQRGETWSGAIYDPKAKRTIYAKRQYADQREAKLAAYDAMQLLIKRPR